MNRIKNILKNTYIYAFYQSWRKRNYERDLIRRFHQWTPSDQNLLEFYENFINKGDLVFDIGANVGNRTKVFLRIGAKVIACEPQNLCFRVLNKALRNVSDAVLLKKAVGASNGTMKLMTSTAHTISSLSKEWITKVQNSGRHGNEKWDGIELVEVDTLDSLITTYGLPSFIKIDTEGFEYEVLSGLSKPVHYISFEFHGECVEKASQCITAISNTRLPRYITTFQLSYGESLEFALPGWISEKEIRKYLDSVDPKTQGDVYAKCDIERSHDLATYAPS